MLTGTLQSSHSHCPHRCSPGQGVTGSPAPPTQALSRHTFSRHRARQSTQPRHQRRRMIQMGLKIVEHFNADFELQPEAEQELHTLLASEAFCKQVVAQCQLQEGTKVQFSGHLFQPVPWSVTSRRGMPAEFEKYADDPKFTIINIPPNFMFQAKIFKPSRLCAVYEQR